MTNFDAASYSIVVTKTREDDEVLYFAYVKEIPDISSYSTDPKDAYEDCIDSLNVLYKDAVEHGKDFPMPYKSASPSAPSGRVTLRMSRSMHADIARCAEEDGVSLNQWIIEALSQRRGYYVNAKSPSVINMVVSSALSPILNKIVGSPNVQTPVVGQELRLSSTDEFQYATIKQTMLSV